MKILKTISLGFITLISILYVTDDDFMDAFIVKSCCFNLENGYSVVVQTTFNLWITF